MKTVKAALSQTVHLVLALAFGLSWIADVRAQSAPSTPELMTYQGYLVNGSGQALGDPNPKNYDVIFRVWDAPVAGNKLWAEQQTVTVDKGYFSILLGEGSSIGEARPALSGLFASPTAGERYVGMTVKGIGTGGADVDIMPRLRLLSAPYSYLAQHAATASSILGTNILGTVPDVRLSTNVALRTGGNAFAGNQTITSGNLGVGTANPAAALHVSSSGAPAMILDGNAGSGTWLTLKQGEATPWHLMATPNGNFGIGYGGGPGAPASYLSFGANGNMGLSVPTPLARLDISGSMRVDTGALAGPGNGTLGSVGTRISLWPGTQNQPPYAFGVDTATLWSGVPESSFFKWYVGTVQQMVLTKSGLGLGTSGTAIAGNARLQVQNGSIMPSAGNNASSGICWPADPAGGSGDLAWIRYYPRTGEGTTFEMGTSNDADDNIALRAPGGVCINGITTGGYALYVNGEGNFTGDVYANGNRLGPVFSDIRLKKDFAEISSPLAKVLALHGFSFNFRTEDSPVRGLPEGRQLGFIAQEVQALLPEAVSEAKDGYFTLNYDAITPVLVEAIKEQQSQLDAKSKQVADLEARLAKLEEMVKALSSAR